MTTTFKPKPEHRAAARALGFALTLDDADGWADFSTVAAKRLTERERAGLAYSALRAQPAAQALWTAEAAVNGHVPPTPPSYLDTPAGRAALVEWREQRDRRRARA